jgi:hypothetical protein
VQGLVAPLTVQIQSQHPVGPSRSGALSLAVFVVGMTCLCWGMVPVVRRHYWRAHALFARGRVVDNIPRPSRDGRVGWLPLVEFESRRGMIRSLISGTPTRHGWPVGYRLDVLYDPTHPQRVQAAEDALTIPWTLIAGLAITGAFFAVILS